MSLTLLVWLVAFSGCLILSLQRSAWAVALYMLTFFCSPQWWWWGGPVSEYRWNLIGGFVLLGSTVITGALFDRRFFGIRINQRFIALAVLSIINASLVHFFAAPNLEISSERYMILLKSTVLFVLMSSSIRSSRDLWIILIAILFGAFYIGYEVTVNDRGRVQGSRLEGVGVANASTANDLACLMVCTTPLIAPVFLYGRLWQKVFAAIAGPLILNVLLLCNSRGAFLSLGMAGAVFGVASPAKVRPLVFAVGFLGLIAGWLLLGDQRIIERFTTTFTSAEERDASAASRIEFWKAGLMMVSDHPLGYGGDAFKVHGAPYIARVTGNYTTRSVHQGYINEACEWGLQGLVLRLSLLVSGLVLAIRTSRLAIANELPELSLISVGVVSSLTGLMIGSLFGTFLDSEWGLWFVAIAIGCHRLVHEQTEQVESDLLL